MTDGFPDCHAPQVSVRDWVVCEPSGLGWFIGFSEAAGAGDDDAPTRTPAWIQSGPSYASRPSPRGASRDALDTVGGDMVACRRAAAALLRDAW
jgi:hypothetical protein